MFHLIPINRCTCEMRASEPPEGRMPSSYFYRCFLNRFRFRVQHFHRLLVVVRGASCIYRHALHVSAGVPLRSWHMRSPRPPHNRQEPHPSQQHCSCAYIAHSRTSSESKPHSTPDAWRHFHFVARTPSHAFRQRGHVLGFLILETYYAAISISTATDARDTTQSKISKNTNPAIPVRVIYPTSSSHKQVMKKCIVLM